MVEAIIEVLRDGPRFDIPESSRNVGTEAARLQYMRFIEKRVIPLIAGSVRNEGDTITATIEGSTGVAVGKNIDREGN